MALFETYIKSGNTLFKYRSYIPLILAPFLIAYLFIQRETLDTFIDNYIQIGISLLVCAVGLAIRAFTIGYAHPNTSGRNVNQQRADHINTSGIYSMVRHPLYLGNMMIWLGIGLRFGSWWLTLGLLVFFWLYYEKIMFAEEEFLRTKFGDSFTQWAEKTPLIFPNPFLYKKPKTLFFWKRIFRKEPDSAYAPILMLFVIDLCAAYFHLHRFYVSTIWIIIISVATIIYLALKYMKKRTKLLVETP